ncbi:glucose-1-phosphate thymidylyltransferase [Nonlabens dokdonensis]|uniref:Glucose-1-phosphate nucleotidyl transferase n=3 Tax=Nonlabens dokdonensis TaxID=328515 RepID=L7W8X2_NONDD|nr:glucose-1-phosphate nucleotidyl transferase [Nonlabens dokdonensis DSW-6]PZX44321.1 glucose-1-phosphate thymidylyltransferase [Nonlabens dokdonensis]
MAGRGSRLRPHSLTTPKPLIPIANQPIVHRLVKDIARILSEPVEEIAFILGDPAFFGDDVVKSLEELAQGLGAKASIYRQLEPLGTGHAIMCAEPSLSGPAVVAYADTLIRANFELDPAADAVIWTKQVEKPEAYGVVKLNEKEEIVELVEKPQQFVSDQAVIGIYYFKEIADLKKELQFVIDNEIINGGEYQINDGIKRMMASGNVFKTGTVDEWMDCGNKVVAIETNQRIMSFMEKDGSEELNSQPTLQDSKIIPPCVIDSSVVLKNSTVGPHVSIGAGTVIENCTITNSLIQKDSVIKNATLEEAMIGNHVKYDGKFTRISIGDYTIME